MKKLVLLAMTMDDINYIDNKFKIPGTVAYYVNRRYTLPTLIWRDKNEMWAHQSLLNEKGQVDWIGGNDRYSYAQLLKEAITVLRYRQTSMASINTLLLNELSPLIEKYKNCENYHKNFESWYMDTLGGAV